jgi:peptidoglycan/xylan/chitin deacetylase (PgdA/CDA1 family)
MRSRSPVPFFFLLLSFGVLFVGCGSQEPENAFDSFTFTDKDLSEVHTLSNSGVVKQAGSSATIPSGVTILGASGSSTLPPVLQVGTASGIAITTSVLTPAASEEKKRLYTSLRTAVSEDGRDLYRVNNAFLNVRSQMDASSRLVVQLHRGDMVQVVDIPNAAWAKVKLLSGQDGFVSFRYIAKVTTEEKLATEKKKFEGKYFVDFQFLNVRQEPSSQSIKVAEIPGQTIIRPLSMNGEWARVSWDGKEGYASRQYLRAFQPTFLVRQDAYTLPILRYSADDSASIAALPKHIAFLQSKGYAIKPLSLLMDTVLAQESKDTRIPPNTASLTITSVTAKNIRVVSDALGKAKVTATLFVLTKDIGISGITEKMALTILANGHELQSGGHTGDDLRSLTDSQLGLELNQSKKLLEDLTKREVYALAYPRGGVNDRVMEKMANAGYLFGAADSSDRQFTRAAFLRLPGLLITGVMSAEDVLKLVE